MNLGAPILLLGDSDGDGKVVIEGLKVFMTYYEKANPPVKL